MSTDLNFFGPLLTLNSSDLNDLNIEIILQFDQNQTRKRLEKRQSSERKDGT